MKILLFEVLCCIDCIVATLSVFPGAMPPQCPQGLPAIRAQHVPTSASPRKDSGVSSEAFACEDAALSQVYLLLLILLQL